MAAPARMIGVDISGVNSGFTENEGPSPPSSALILNPINRTITRNWNIINQKFNLEASLIPKILMTVGGTRKRHHPSSSQKDKDLEDRLERAS
jgi:hypothetical protein